MEWFPWEREGVDFMRWWNIVCPSGGLIVQHDTGYRCDKFSFLLQNHLRIIVFRFCVIIIDMFANTSDNSAITPDEQDVWTFIKTRVRNTIFFLSKRHVRCEYITCVSSTMFVWYCRPYTAHRSNGSNVNYSTYGLKFCATEPLPSLYTVSDCIVCIDVYFPPRSTRNLPSSPVRYRYQSVVGNPLFIYYGILHFSHGSPNRRNQNIYIVDI